MTGDMCTIDDKALACNGPDGLDNSNNTVMALPAKNEGEPIAEQPIGRSLRIECTELCSETLQKDITMGIPITAVDQAEILDVQHQDGGFLVCEHHMLEMFNICCVIGDSGQ